MSIVDHCVCNALHVLDDLDALVLGLDDDDDDDDAADNDDDDGDEICLDLHLCLLLLLPYIHPQNTLAASYHLRKCRQNQRPKWRTGGWWERERRHKPVCHFHRYRRRCVS